MPKSFGSGTTFRRTVLVIAVCALAALSSPTSAFAADDGASGATDAAPANPPANAPGMAGCKDSVNGVCCGTCQEKAAVDKPADQAAGDCPCKRAKQAQKGS